MKQQLAPPRSRRIKLYQERALDLISALTESNQIDLIKLSIDQFLVSTLPVLVNLDFKKLEGIKNELQDCQFQATKALADTPKKIPADLIKIK